MSSVSLLAMAACPALHNWLHVDAGTQDHHCAVTALLDGQFDRFTDLPVVAALPSPQVPLAPVLHSHQDFVPGSPSTLRGRAPPSA